MGHNLQSLNFYGKMGEASNNIFPVWGRQAWNAQHPSMCELQSLYIALLRLTSMCAHGA